MDVAGGGAVRDHRHRQRHGVGGILEDLHVQHRGEAAESLGTDTQRIDLVRDLQAQRLHVILRAARAHRVQIDGCEQGFLGQQHGLLRRAADADAEHAGRAPAGAHAGDGLEDPVDDAVAGVEHGEARLVLRAAALGGDAHIDGVAGHHARVDHRRGVVAGVDATGDGRVDHGGAQHVVRVRVGAAHALVDHVLETHVRVPANVHADVDEGHDDAGVLADGSAALGAHARVGEDLRHGILGRRRLLARIGLAERLHVVHRVVIRDELQRVADAVDDVALPDGRHHGGVRGPAIDTARRAPAAPRSGRRGRAPDRTRCRRCPRVPRRRESTIRGYRPDPAAPG